METMQQKIDRIRRSGWATLRPEATSPLYRYAGNRFRVAAIDKPGPRCRVTIVFRGRKISVKLDDVL